MKEHYTLVTGAARGIGAAVVEALLTQGHAVFALDVDADALSELTQRLRDRGHLEAQPVDVRDASAVDAAVASAERSGPLDGLVHAAGILRLGRCITLSDDDWRDTFAVNVDGLRHVARAVTARMYERGRGSMVTVASNAARVPRSDMGAYAASKAAAVMLTKTFALELAPRVRCNIVSPGSTDTAMQRRLWTDDHGPARVIEGSLGTYRTGIPLQRIAQPSDIAAAVCFLLSPAAAQVTMADLCVDGGATLGV